MLNVAEFESYQALIFDMDGTIIDSMPSHAKAWKLVGETMGYSLNENIMYQLGGASVYKIAQRIMQEANMPLELIDEVVKLKREYGKQLLLSETTLLPTVDVIRHFFGHKPMALGTGSHQVITELLLDKFNLQHYFNAIVTSDDVQQHKPAPDTFLRCAELLQVPPQHCVVFEDADLGIQAGLAAGMAVFDVRVNQFVKR